GGCAGYPAFRRAGAVPAAAHPGARRPGHACPVAADPLSARPGHPHHGPPGSEEIHVDPFGNVFPCLHLRWPAGNLHRQSIAEIWNDSPVFARARHLSVATARRWAGQQPTQFGAPLFCPGLALTCGSDAPAASGSKTVQPIFFRAGSRRASAQSE
ncbi:MAG TPA: SPASM domain-containing protein, partial [Candidatus Contendobacter sp.]|nr:SPASM domain-containing protein [Candidatus Contendobacter sp.]